METYELIWNQAKGILGKASRRITAALMMSNEQSYSKLHNLIIRDTEEVRTLVSEIIQSDSNSPESIIKRLSKANTESWSDIDESQWCFSYVAKQLDYRIFFGETNEIGYKRRKQGNDYARKNELFDADESGSIIVNSESPKKLIDKFLSRKNFKPSLGGFNSNFSDIGGQVFLRCDPKYRWFWDHKKGKCLDTSSYFFVPISKFVSLAEKIIVRKGELSQERNLIDLNDVESGTGRIINVNRVEEIGADRIEFSNSDIVFSRLEPYLCKAILNDPSQEYIGSTEWLTLVVNKNVALKEYVWCFLVSSIGREVFRLLQSGKRHARINVEDFLKILVPDITKEQQQNTVANLKPTWNKIEQIIEELTCCIMFQLNLDKN